MKHKTTCRKCGTSVIIDFGKLTREEAVACIDTLNRTPMECPGYHTELGGWRYLWNLDQLLKTAYPNPDRKNPDGSIP